MTTKRLTQAQLEAIRKRVRLVTAGEWRRANYAVYGGNHGITVANAPTKNDAEFIAHSRQDIPALLAEVERLSQALLTIAHGDTWTAYPHDIAAWALGLEKGKADTDDEYAIREAFAHMAQERTYVDDEG